MFCYIYEELAWEKMAFSGTGLVNEILILFVEIFYPILDQIYITIS